MLKIVPNDFSMNITPILTRMGWEWSEKDGCYFVQIMNDYEEKLFDFIFSPFV